MTLKKSPGSSRSIAAYLRCGGLIAYPTEYCYDLGCDPRNRRAVQKLLKLKQRPQHKGLILIAGKFRQLAPYLQSITPSEQDTLRRDGAQAVTYLMPAKSNVPRWLRGTHDTLAVAHRPSAGSDIVQCASHGAGFHQCQS